MASSYFLESELPKVSRLKVSRSSQLPEGKSYDHRYRAIWIETGLRP
jgi:hypothetical protein